MRLDRVVQRIVQAAVWCGFALFGIATVGYIYGGIWVLATIW